MSERTLNKVLDDLVSTDIAGGYDLTHFPKAKRLVTEARAIGEKLQAEINALRGGIEAHKVEAERRAAVRENGRRRLIIYADSDRKMHVECPHCGKAITSDGPKLVLYDNDVFECVKCGERIVIADILGGTQYATASLSMDVAKQQDFHTASCVFLPVHINGLMRGHARLPIIGHCGDPDGCAVIVRLGKVDFPLPVDFDPSK